MHPHFKIARPLFTTRREFVLGSLLGGVALAAGLGCAGASKSSGTADASSAASGTSEGRKLGVALLGLGSYSEGQLAPALRRTRHCALRGIVTGTPAKVGRWQREHGIADRNVYDYAGLARIADNRDIDVVYVVTPTALHAKYAIMAAEAGKHVWCEKPMAMTVTQCQSILDACRANKVSLSVGYRMQHEPNTQTVMRFAKERPYGPIRSIRAVAGDKNPGEPSWRMVRSMGGGALYDMGVYAINAIRYASGEEPVRVVRAKQWAERPELFHDVDENTEFELELPSGVIAYGKASRSNNENVLRVTAERGGYHLEPMQSYTGVEGETTDGKKLDLPIDNQQAKQMDDEALAILEGRPPVVSGEEGQRDIRIIEAILDAARTGSPVSVG
ncbi:MAG: Gfo/Idh/MocA family oxidoreductase [Polyangiales bacterium]